MTVKELVDKLLEQKQDSDVEVMCDGILASVTDVAQDYDAVIIFVAD